MNDHSNELNHPSEELYDDLIQLTSDAKHQTNRSNRLNDHSNELNRHSEELYDGLIQLTSDAKDLTGFINGFMKLK